MQELSRVIYTNKDLNAVPSGGKLIKNYRTAGQLLYVAVGMACDKLGPGEIAIFGTRGAASVTPGY